MPICLEVRLRCPISIFVLNIVRVECVDLEEADTWVACFHGIIVTFLLSASVVIADRHDLSSGSSNGAIEVFKGLQLKHFSIVRVVATTSAAVVTSEPLLDFCLVAFPGAVLDPVEQLSLSVSFEIGLCGSVRIFILDVVGVKSVYLV